MLVCPQCRLIYDDASYDVCGIDGTALVDQPDDPMVGNTFDRFQISKLIGVGAMGRVYEGLHPSLNRKVAIKVLYGDYASEERFRQRFEREGQALAKIRHRNVVSVTDFGQSDGVHFLVMDFIEGGSLEDLVEKKAPFSPVRAARIGKQIAAGLAEAHEHGLVHRDLKPANIIVDEEKGDATRILDFGVVSLLYAPITDNRLTADGQVIGTPMYMSPEQTIDPDVTPASDLYSLGIIMYEMLAGRPPFLYESRMAMMLAHVQETPPALPDAGGLEGLVLELLKKQPKDRPASGTEVVKAIEELEAGGTLTDSQLVERASTIPRDPAEVPRRSAESDPDLRTFDTFPSLRSPLMTGEDWKVTIPDPVDPDSSSTQPMVPLDKAQRFKSTVVVRDRKPKPGSARFVEKLDNEEPVPKVDVLVIDADFERVQRLRQALSSLFNIGTATTLEEGISAAQSGRFAAVVANLTLPDSDGLELLDRARWQVKGAPIIVVSNIQMDWLAVEAIRRGAQDYVVLSEAGYEQLGYRVRFAVERRSSATLASTRPSKVPSPAPLPKPQPKEEPVASAWPSILIGLLLAGLGLAAGRVWGLERGARAADQARHAPEPTFQPTDVASPSKAVPKKSPELTTKMLTVISSPSGAEVRADGRIIGRTPLITAYEGGNEVVVEINQDGYITWKRVIEENEQGQLVVHAVLSTSTIAQSPQPK